MRVILVLTAALLLASPTVAKGGTFAVLASGGPTISDPGYSLSAGVGFSPSPRVMFTVSAELTHLASRVEGDSQGQTAFRGGTLTVAAVEVRAGLFGRDRVGPYALGGAAAGRSRPTVNEVFRNPVTNAVGAVFLGGGLHVPLKDTLTLFADVRMMIGTEAGELLAVAPVRAGLAWQF